MKFSVLIHKQGKIPFIQIECSEEESLELAKFYQMFGVAAWPSTFCTPNWSTDA